MSTLQVYQGTELDPYSSLKIEWKINNYLKGAKTVAMTGTWDADGRRGEYTMVYELSNADDEHLSVQDYVIKQQNQMAQDIKLRVDRQFGIKNEPERVRRIDYAN